MMFQFKCMAKYVRDGQTVIPRRCAMVQCCRTSDPDAPVWVQFTDSSETCKFLPTHTIVNVRFVHLGILCVQLKHERAIILIEHAPKPHLNKLTEWAQRGGCAVVRHSPRRLDLVYPTPFSRDDGWRSRKRPLRVA